jgi:hypothetical protein
MAGQERDSLPRHLADRDRVTGHPEGGLYLDFFGILKKLIESRAADDGNTGHIRHNGQATFSLGDDEDDDPVDEALAVSLDFFSALSALPAESVELDDESLPAGSLALAGVAEELPFLLSVR